MFVLENLTDDHFVDYMWTWVSEKYDKSAYEYLQYAIDDLQDGSSSRHLVNAISNAKKALHIRMEELGEGFGMGSNNTQFPHMLKYLKNCGFVAPRVLDRINKYRNKVEHQYFTPELEDVETYIDVIQLFIESTRKWMERCVAEIDIARGVLDESGGYELSRIKFEWNKGEINLQYRALKENERKDKKIKRGESNYFTLISMALKNDH